MIDFSVLPAFTIPDIQPLDKLWTDFDSFLCSWSVDPQRDFSSDLAILKLFIEGGGKPQRRRRRGKFKGPPEDWPKGERVLAYGDDAARIIAARLAGWLEGVVKGFERRHRPRRLPPELWDALPRIDFEGEANYKLGEFLMEKLEPSWWTYIGERKAKRYVYSALLNLTRYERPRQCLSLSGEGEDGLIPIKLPRDCVYGNTTNGTDEERTYHASKPDVGMVRHLKAIEGDRPQLVDGMVADCRDGAARKHAEEADAFEAFACTLPSWHAEAVRLWVKGMDKKAIAAQLGRDRGQVHTVLVRAINRLHAFDPDFVEWYFRRHGRIFQKSLPTLPPSR